MRFNINFRAPIYQATPSRKRKPKFIRFLFSAIKPLTELNKGMSALTYVPANTYNKGDRVLYNNNYYWCMENGVTGAFDSTKWADMGKQTGFYPFYTKWTNFLKFNSQTITLTKYLNDVFDSLNRGIFITNTANTNVTFLYNIPELKPPVYLYNLWRAITTYALDERIVRENGVYKSLQAGNLNRLPEIEPLWWGFEKDVLFLFNDDEAGSQYDFIVYVPSSVTFSETVMRAEIDQYKLAGKLYLILTY